MNEPNREAARIAELEAQLAEAERMYRLVASERTATLVSEYRDRADNLGLVCSINHS